LNLIARVSAPALCDYSFGNYNITKWIIRGFGKMYGASIQESERLFRLACLYDKAVEVFEDPQMARKWLKEPSWALGDVTPLRYADTELGAQEVEDLLGRIEHGVFT
jgi:putative toxin-antitoxin system antitoxin component (TIGR02293 family)